MDLNILALVIQCCIEGIRYTLIISIYCVHGRIYIHLTWNVDFTTSALQVGCSCVRIVPDGQKYASFVLQTNRVPDNVVSYLFHIGSKGCSNCFIINNLFYRVYSKLCSRRNYIVINSKNHFHNFYFKFRKIKFTYLLLMLQYNMIPWTDYWHLTHLSQWS